MGSSTSTWDVAGEILVHQQVGEEILVPTDPARPASGTGGAIDSS